MLNNQLSKLAATLSPTDPVEPDPYLLTPEEEESAIAIAIEQAKKFMAWKQRRVLKTQDEIEFKISQVNWDEKINRQNVLSLANAAKNSHVWQQQQRQADKDRELNRAKELVQYWTYGRIYKLMKYNSLHIFGKPLEETATNLPAIKALCFFLARDDRFADDLGFDRLKGLLIRGPTGTGKTHLVRCTEDNGLNPILTLSMLEITDRVQEDGSYSIDMQGRSIIYLDDVGTEEAEVKHFGTVKLWFKNFIEKSHLKSKSYNHLIITTNLNFKGLEDQYGVRVASRMREMFNVVDLTGEDRRKQSTSLGR